MSHLKPLTIEEAPEQSKQILEGLKKQIGHVPNVFAALSHSPSALKALVSLSEILSKAELSPKEVEIVDLVMAQKNSCEYCQSAHTAMAKAKGFSDEQILGFRKGRSSDAKQQALIDLTKEILESGGFPKDTAIDVFLKAGFSTGALAVLPVVIAKNVLTNYFNHIAKTPVDFPAVEKI